MEGEYGVYWGTKVAGKVQVRRQGLYYLFSCRCMLTGDIICRLVVCCGEHKESLGIVVPMDSGFGIDTKLPVKKLGEGSMTFVLRPKQETAVGKFVPIYPEEPFTYITRLKEAFLERKNGQLGIMIEAGAE